MILLRSPHVRAALCVFSLATVLFVPSHAIAAMEPAITYQDGIASAPLQVSWNIHGHSSGTWRIDRWRASSINDVCGAFALDTTVTASLRSYPDYDIFSDTTASAGYCYRYRLVQDLVGTVNEYTSTAVARIPGVAPSTPTGVTIDTVPPSGTHAATLPADTASVQLAWTPSTGGSGGLSLYQWCITAAGATCATALRTDFAGPAMTSLTTSAALVPGSSYIACVRAGSITGHWSELGCSPVSMVAPIPPVDTSPKPCTTKVGEAMQRTAQIGTSFVYTLGDWASCPFPNGDRVDSIDYLLCANGNVHQCYLVRHRPEARSSAAGVRTLGIPLVHGETFGSAALNPSVRLYSNTKKAHPWVVQVTARAASGATQLLHTWTLNFVTGTAACDQSPLTVIADPPVGGRYAAMGSITCTGSGFTYRAKARSAASSVVVDAKGDARYTTTTPTAGSDSFAIEAQQGSTTYERNVVVQFSRYAVGTGGDDTMVGSNANSVKALSLRAKRLTARGDVLLGGAGKDTIHGRGGDDVIRGQAGNDKLYPGAGANVTDGGAGNDTILVVSTRDIVHGGAGNDKITIRSKTGPKRITCGTGRDTVIAPRTLKLPKDCERLVIRRTRG